MPFLRSLLPPHSRGHGAAVGAPRPPGSPEGAGAVPGSCARSCSQELCPELFTGSFPGPRSSRRCAGPAGVPPAPFPGPAREGGNRQPVLPPRGRSRALQRGPRGRGRPPARALRVYSFTSVLLLLFIHLSVVSFIHSYFHSFLYSFTAPKAL